MDIKGKVILLTGASRGLGAEIAKQLIIQGGQVIAVSRNIKLLEQLDDFAQTYNSKITIVPMDITNFASIYELGKIVYEKFGVLDIFIGNAAIVGSSTLVAHYSPQTWHKILEINYIANWHFIRSLDSLLKLSKSPRCCFISCNMAKDNRPFFAAYNASKAALESMVLTYANENCNTSLKANIISLPLLKTTLFKGFLDKEIESSTSSSKYVNDILQVVTHNENYGTIVNIEN